VAYRIAAISDDLSTDFADAAGVAQAAGLDGLAVRNVGGINVRDLSRDRLVDIRSIAGAHGLEISAVSSSLGRDSYLGDDSALDNALLERMVDAAQLLGTPLVRVFATWLPGKDALPEWAERPRAIPSGVADRLAALARIAEAGDVTLMLELEGASYAGTIAEAQSLLVEVGSPALALCWDVCNGWWSGENPWDEGWPAARAMPIVDVQVKDVALMPDGRPAFDQVVLGQGDLPYDRIISALLADGYEGWFTAERVYHPRKPENEPRLRADLLADIANLKTLLTVAADAGAP